MFPFKIHAQKSSSEKRPRNAPKKQALKIEANEIGITSPIKVIT
jgi:hypothetical protein